MNMIGLFRSNYFLVNDRTAFSTWCKGNGLEMIEDGAFVGFVNMENEAGIPWIRTEDVDDEEREVEFDLLAELADHLVAGHVAIVIEIVYEGYRYLGGTAHAINNKHERKTVDLSSITELAQTLGEHVRICEY